MQGAMNHTGPAIRRARAIMLAALIASPASFACTVASSTQSFGVINPLIDGQRDSTAGVSVGCPTLTSYTLSLSAGSGTYNQRTLLSGSRTLNYNLYIDAQRTQIWGDGSGATWTVPGSADSTSTLHTIYGSVPAQPFAVPGTYSDTVVITVSY